MPPTYETDASANSGGTEVTTLQVTKPTGTVDGDIVLLSLVTRGTPGTVTPPTGFTLVEQTGANSAFITTYAKQASSDGASYTFSWVSSRRAALIAMRVSAASLPDAAIANGTAAVATDPVAPSITTVSADNLLIGIACINGAVNQTFTPPTGYTEQEDGSNGDATFSLSWSVASKLQAVAGASGTATFDSTAVTATDTAAQHIAVPPSLSRSNRTLMGVG